MQKCIAELGANHGVQHGLFRNWKAHFAQGRGYSSCDTAGWIDKGAVQIENYGHRCLSHRVSFSRVAACLKLACRYWNTSAVLRIFSGRPAEAVRQLPQNFRKERRGVAVSGLGNLLRCARCDDFAST